MSRVIGQRWEIYDYQKVKDIVLKRGENAVVKNTPDYGRAAIVLLSRASDLTIETLYNEWKSAEETPYATKTALGAGVAAVLKYTDENKIDKEEKARAGGVATLGEDGTVPADQLPSTNGLLAVAHDGVTLDGKGTSEQPLSVKDEGITTQKIAASAVTTAKIADGAITPEKLSLPVGKIYIQLPSEPTPAQAGLPGTWVPWNDRPVLYGLSTSYPSAPAYDANATSAIAANQYRTVTHADGDIEIFQSIAQIPLQTEGTYNGKIGPFDPVKWRELRDPAVSSSYRPVYRARNVIANHSWSTDLTMGATVTAPNDSGVNTTYRVTGIHSLKGKFLSGAGGNRPPFEGGGVHGDVSRPITGYLGSTFVDTAVGGIKSITGPFVKGATTGSKTGGGTSNDSHYDIDMNTGRATPVGLENSPRTMAAQYWRRIA
jgi:hypothetical protein